ncbi:ABC transporter ATP-binding protein [Rummeliibacillus suwonensis]|uniref:ABC transporter ATP-binding protein n=1 Tax=Rummeliibacillus suwonensis TaxID=1306154 RepID=UPI0028A0E7D6|nr:ABC transporter ATP-binding protein [Rummeliibacillus suwonensis]
MKQKKVEYINYKNLLILIPFLKKTIGLFISGIVGMLLSSLISAPIPYIYGYIIDNIVMKNKGYVDLIQIILILLIIYLLSYLLSIIYQYFFTQVQQKIVNEIRISMVKKIIDSPFSFIDKKDKGYLLGRISESGNISTLFTPNVMGTFAGLCDFLFSIFIMLKLSVELSLISLAVLPVYFFVSKYSSQKIANSTTGVYETSAILNGELYETLNGIEDIKLLNGRNIQIMKLKKNY